MFLFAKKKKITPNGESGVKRKRQKLRLMYTMYGNQVESEREKKYSIGKHNLISISFKNRWILFSATCGRYIWLGVLFFFVYNSLCVGVNIHSSTFLHMPLPLMLTASVFVLNGQRKSLPAHCVHVSSLCIVIYHAMSCSIICSYACMCACIPLRSQCDSEKKRKRKRAKQINSQPFSRTWHWRKIKKQCPVSEEHVFETQYIGITVNTRHTYFDENHKDDSICVMCISCILACMHGHV